MLNKFKNAINFIKNITFSNIKNVVVTFIKYIINLLKEIYADIKSNSGNAIVFIAWLLISLLWGFTFPILAMLIVTCYIHHMKEDEYEVCNHEDIIKYALMICIGSILHCIF